MNAEEPAEQAIVALWQEYLLSDYFLKTDSEYWSYEGTTIPDFHLVGLLMDIIGAKREGRQIQVNTIGIFPVEQNHYALKTVFTRVRDSTQQVALDYSITVYAKATDSGFVLVGSPQYHRLVWQKEVVGDVTYYIHPDHTFNLAEARKMDAFNQEIAALYGMEPLSFDYFVTNYTRDLLPVVGTDFMPKAFQSAQSGGMAVVHNKTLYAGNNSEYYPHELVHLYNFNKVDNRIHTWVDEGIATFFGGSTGYDLAWHKQQLKNYLLSDPSFKMDSLSALTDDVPGSDHITNFKYVISGLLCEQIHQKEGMQGFFDALTTENNDAAYFAMLEEKLGMQEDELDGYIREVLGL